MKIQIHKADQMTPIERRAAIREGRDYDRIPCVPFMSELKCRISDVTIWDFWHDPRKMAETEILCFNRYGHDRLHLGPNCRGMMEALGGETIYPDTGLPHAGTPLLSDYDKLEQLEQLCPEQNERLQTFLQAAQLLTEQAGALVPIEAAIGGPFTTASMLRGTETLLRDCIREMDQIHRLMRIITDLQKWYVDQTASLNIGYAMADPVANPALIGSRLYEKLVFPYTKEITDYVYEKTGQKVSLHMCGTTYGIWKYLRQYQLNELSLDNIIDLNRAVSELGAYIPIAGNVDPVEIILNGRKEEIVTDVHRCISQGLAAKKGFTLATGCDIPEMTSLEKIDWFMDAARHFNYRDIL